MEAHVSEEKSTGSMERTSSWKCRELNYCYSLVAFENYLILSVRVPFW